MITQQKQWRVDKSLTLPRATPQSRRLRVQEVLSGVAKGSGYAVGLIKEAITRRMSLFQSVAWAGEESSVALHIAPR